MAKGASASGARPFFLVWIELKSAFLDAEGLVTAAALLADDGQRRLQRIEIRDLALSVRYGLAEACDVLAETSLVFPDLRRGAVIALPLGPLEAVGKQRRKILGSILELGERGINRSLVIWLFSLDHRSQRAGVLSVALHVSLRMLERILLRYHRADTEQQRSNNHDSSHHQFDPSGFLKRTVNSLHVAKTDAVMFPTPRPGFHSPNACISQTMPALMLANRDPDPLSGRRHVDMIDLVFSPQPFDDRVDDRRTGADRAGLARALDAERIGLAGDVVRLEHKGRAVRGAWQRIVHERSRDELSVLRIIDRLLHQGLTDPLHRAAMYLAGKQ